ncbi:flagellar basal body rod C-terminal domain-containing protein [Thalassobaculum sp.]|uniref:flagellar basal body rod C-terminal domain-containing protein n=1 Tax=Thalassobaculum sp. TaxID=2022740 RepID=UPI0032EAD340
MAITNALSSALSGVQAAERRFGNSANNVANLRSQASPTVDGPATDAEGRTLFRAASSVDQTTATGGVRSSQLLVDPSSIQEYDPSASHADADGLVHRPNVDLVRETADQIAGQRQLEANLASIRAADELLQATLDIKS